MLYVLLGKELCQRLANVVSSFVHIDTGYDLGTEGAMGDASLFVARPMYRMIYSG